MNIAKANKDMKKVFHENGFTGKDCVIAVLDTAVGDVGKMRSHIEHADNYRVDDKNTDDHASFICNMLYDWAPDATLLSYCVFPDGKGNMGLTNKALEAVIERAKADPDRQYFVNMSLAGNVGKDYISPVVAKMRILIQELNKIRVPVYVAAGNDGSEQLYIYPSRFPEPVCITAANSNGSVASYSTWHDQSDFCEMGTDIVGITRFGTPTMMSGTSMACPNALGKAVLLACKMREDTGTWPTEMQLYNEMRACAIDCETVGYDKKSGYGFVDIRKTDGIYKHVESIEIPLTWKDAFKETVSAIMTLLKQTGIYPADEVSDAPYTKVIKFGSEGPDVKRVKDKLLELGYLKTSTKYTFGGDSRAAVKKFQSDHGLDVDGKVGPITWNALFNLSTPSDESEPSPNVDFDLSLIPENISRSKAVAIARDLAGVSEVRRNMVLDVLQYAVDPDNLPKYPKKFYIRGGNLYNKDLSLNVMTRAKLNAYFRNGAYEIYYNNGRDEMMLAASEEANFSIPGDDCSGQDCGLLRKHCASTETNGVKKAVSSGFDANANTLYAKYCVPTDNPKPGDMMHKDGHAGLVAGGGYAVESAGGEFGTCLSDITNRRIYSFMNKRMHKMGAWEHVGKWVFLDD